MATVTYTGTFGYASVGKDGLVATLTAPSIPSKASAINFSISVRADTYHPDCSWCLYWVAITSDTGSTYFRKKINDRDFVVLEKMSSNEYTLTGDMIFNNDDWQFTGKSITLHAKIGCNYSDTQCYLGDASVSVSYPANTSNRNLLVNNLTWDSGKTAVLSWESNLLANNEEFVCYFLGRKSSREYAWIRLEDVPYQRFPNYVLPYDILKTWEDEGNVSFFVGTYVYHPSDNTYSYTHYSNCVTFRYRPDNTLSWYDGNEWVECIPYYYDGNDWIQCDPYYHDGDDWTLCSNS